MSERHTIAAQVRERAGKGASRATRRAGLVPAVIYGAKKDPIPVSLERRMLVAEIEKGSFSNRLLDIEIDGTTEHVLPRDVQFHPVSDLPLHVDFLRVTDDTLIHVEVPVHFEGEDECPGLRLGGVLNIVRHEVGLKCRAGAIPESLHASLAGLEIGDSVRISSISLPEGASPLITNRDFTIATIAAPTVQVEEVPGEEGAPAPEAAEGEEAQAGEEKGEDEGEKG